MDGLTSLSHVCDREKIQYSAVHAAESEYGVDTFSIRVEAQNQAAVDALIANFSGGTCEMQFSYNSSGGFDLNIYNRKIMGMKLRNYLQKLLMLLQLHVMMLII